MSAIRVHDGHGHVRLADPHTGEDYRPGFRAWNEVFPVERRKATPEELGRTGGVHVAKTNIKFPPRPPRPKGIYIAHLSDTDVLAALVGRTQHEAASALNVSQASLCRRLRQIREGKTA